MATPAPWRQAVSQRQTGPRRAFTLLELVLVLALLLVISSLAWPALQRTLSAQRLQRAAELVRSEWIRARLAAIDSGDVQIFRYEPETGNYAVESWTIDSASATAGAAPSVSIASQRAAAEVDSVSRLPEEIVFVVSATAADSRSVSTSSELAGSGAIGLGGPEPIYFYPDGVTSDASLILRSYEGGEIQIDLRGLTGVVQIGEVVATEPTPLAERLP